MLSLDHNSGDSLVASGQLAWERREHICPPWVNIANWERPEQGQSQPIRGKESVWWPIRGHSVIKNSAIFHTVLTLTELGYLHNIFWIIIEWIPLFQVCLFLFIQLSQTYGDDGQVYLNVKWNHLSFFPDFPCLNATKNAGALSVLSQRSPYSCSIIEFAPNTKLIDKTYIN